MAVLKPNIFGPLLVLVWFRRTTNKSNKHEVQKPIEELVVF